MDFEKLNIGTFRIRIYRLCKTIMNTYFMVRLASNRKDGFLYETKIVQIVKYTRTYSKHWCIVNKA